MVFFNIGLSRTEHHRTGSVIVHYAVKILSALQWTVSWWNMPCL